MRDALKAVAQIVGFFVAWVLTSIFVSGGLESFFPRSDGLDTVALLVSGIAVTVVAQRLSAMRRGRAKDDHEV